jgi:hypothetical protein
MPAVFPDLKVRTRRSFLKTSALTAIAAPYVARTSWAVPPSERLSLLSCGAAGQAVMDLNLFIRNPAVRAAAVADIDASTFQPLMNFWPDLRTYADWRELLDKEGAEADIVSISTPDHMHAPIAMTALSLGKHVFCQKPLTHTVHESRALTDYARTRPLATQMGIQQSSSVNDRLVEELLRNGTLGAVKSIHAFSQKDWGYGDALPAQPDPVPPEVNWDLWLGVASKRSYLEKHYHPRAWRRRVDFGTGTLGDMGCHLLSPAFRALELGAPRTIRSVGSAPTPESWPTGNEVVYTFDGTKFTDGNTLTFTWFDAGRMPPAEIRQVLPENDLPSHGAIITCTEGTLVQRHGLPPILLPEEKFRRFTLPSLPHRDHYYDFIKACREQDHKASAHFDYSGPLTEAVLAGVVATRFPNRELNWDTAGLRFSNAPEASRYLKKSYRAGWDVKGL